MTLLRLTGDHEVMKKLEQIFDFMAHLGIKIEIDERVIVVSHKDTTYKMLDLERPFSGDYSDIYCLPPQMEYKLVYENRETLE
jgi:hypothetical protein